MKLITTAANLRAALRVLRPAIERRTTYPVLTCVLADGPTLTTTNLDIEIRSRVVASEARGRAAIDYHALRVLAELVPPAEQIQVAAGKDEATVSFPGGRYDLPLIEVDSFPSMPAKDEDKRLSLDGGRFDQALKFVAPTMSEEETRYYLNGFCFSTDRDGNPVLVTTDGHRMAVHPFRFVAPWLDGKIVPRATAKVLCTMPKAEALVTYAGAERIRFEWPGGVSLVSKLIEGTFPDWKRVLPKVEPGASAITFDREEMARALRRVSALYRKGQPYVAIAFNRDRAVLGFKHVDHGTGREFLTNVKIVNAKEDAAIGFRSDYLQALLRMFGASDEVTIFSGGPNAPMLLRGAGTDAFSVLMPARAEDSVALNALRDVEEIGRAA